MGIRGLFQYCLIALAIADENTQRGRTKRMAVYRDSEQIENRYLKSLRKVPWQERIIEPLNSNYLITPYFQVQS